MSDSIRSDTVVHTAGKRLDIEINDLVTAAGRPFIALAIGPVSFYPDRDQVARLRDVLDEYLGDSSVSAWEQDQVELALPPICGGGPDEPFEPSHDDLDQVEHYRPGMPTDDELAQIAAHGCA